MLDDNLSVWLDGGENGLVVVGLSVGSDHREYPFTTGLEFKHLEGVGETVGPPPLREPRRILQGAEHAPRRHRQVARRPERAGGATPGLALVHHLGEISGG